MDDFMSPEDKEALIAFAGPLYSQAKFIDANSIDKDGYQTSRSAQEIQYALERDFNKSPARPPQQHWVEVPPPQYYPSPTVPHVPPAVHYAQPTVDTGQLEFKFDLSEQQKTNTLLEDISRKLTRLISVIEDKDKAQKNIKTHQNVEKLKVEKDELPKVSWGTGKNK